MDNIPDGLIVKITARTFMIADDKVNFVLLSRKRSIKDTRKSPQNSNSQSKFNSFSKR